jgi:probable HAF family extracellular repeat protein
MNNAGQVVGEAYSSPGEYAFLYSGGTMSSLGTPGGTFAEALGINDSGQVAGEGTTASGISRAFLYANGKMTVLGTLGGTESHAYAINRTGQVAGAADTASGALHAALFYNGTVTDLGTPPGAKSTSAEAINDNGQAVGQADLGDGRFHAVLYEGGQVTDLGALPGGGSLSEATGINNVGQIVGSSDYQSDRNFQHAFLYSNGTMADLGTFPGGSYSRAIGINDLGQIVGTSDDGTGPSRPFLLDGGVMTDLNDLLTPGSPWLLSDVIAINDHGQILCAGRTSSVLSHAIVLTPVPEPASLVLLGIVGAGIILPRRRQN